jgi:CheY-like chemotaxis protein
MSARHVVLLVEDEPELAEELGDLLRSLGHDVLHAPTQNEAQAIVEKGGFCYVLLDLQIKVAPDSIKPRVEAGLALLVALRKRFPQRNARDHHALQVIVMSGHAKEHQVVVKAFQEGADDFLQKPLGENRPRIDERIRDALKKAGRDEHEKCAEVATSDQTTAGARVRLAVSGRPVAKRTEILLDEKSALLTNSSFLIFMHLLVGRAKDDKGWVHKTTLGASSDQGWKGVSRLRDEVIAFLPKKTDLTENDKSGYYRINPEVVVERIDLAALEAHWDGRIRKLATELKSLRQA